MTDDQTTQPQPATPRSGLLSNLSTALKILRALGPAGNELLDVFPLPDWSDREAVQTWSIQVIEVGQALAKMTPNTVDDAAALAVRRVLEDSTIWDAVYRESIGIMSTDAMPADWRNRVATCYGDDADEKAIDPLLIIAIIEQIIAIIQWWKNR